MNRLSGDTVRLISSTQVITCASSVVKELVENSLDAGATSIDVKLENSGFTRIEIRDNGSGVNATDVPFAGQRHYTSKICVHEDLQSLSTYGFRGEALGSLCEVATVTICTRTKNELHSTLYTLDSHGGILRSKPSHAPTGTTIVATDLFKNLPVRKQFYNNIKKKKEQIKAMEDFLMSVALAHPKIHINFTNDKKLIWQKARASTTQAALINVLSSPVAKTLKEYALVSEEEKISIRAYLSSDTIVRKTSDRTFLIVNSRPIRNKEIDKVLKQKTNAKEESGWPVCLILIDVPSETLDPNVNASKTQVMLTLMDRVLELLTELLDQCYQKVEAPSHQVTENIVVNTKDSTCFNQNSLPEISTASDTSVDIPNNSAISLFDCDVSETTADDMFLMHKRNAGLDDMNNSDRFPTDKQPLNKEIVSNSENIKKFPLSSATVNSNLEVSNNSKTNCEQNVSYIDSSSIEDQTLNTESWSRGTVNCAAQPMRLLTDALNYSTPVKKVSRKRSCDLNRSSVLQTTLDSIVTSSGKKPRYEFDFESPKNTPSLQRENPAEMFKKSIPKTKSSKRNSFIFVKDFDVNEKIAESSDEEELEVTVRNLEVNINTLRNNIYETIAMKNSKSLPKPQEIIPIGFLPDCKAALIKVKKSLYATNVVRLSEKIVFDRLLQEHKLPCTELEVPLVLSNSDLSFAALDVLENLSCMQLSPPDADWRITDKRINSNGFIINKVKDTETGRTYFQLCSMTLSVPYYSVSELKEILIKIAGNPHVTLTESRPSSVLYYLQGEAARIAWGNPLPDKLCEVTDMLHHLLNGRELDETLDSAECFHRNAIFHKLKIIRKNIL